MRIVQISIFSLILITCVGSQLSADSYLSNREVLSRLLSNLRFSVREISAVYPARLDRYDALFLHNIDEALTETQVQDIKNFVNAGGTLIVTGKNQALHQLYAAFGLELQKLTKRLEFAYRIPNKPLFPQHPVDEIRTRTNFAIKTSQREVAILYGTEDDAVVVTLRDGKGRAFFIASDSMFRKSGLRHVGNAMFLYNLTSTFPRNARIGLAVWKYYTRESKPQNPFAALLFRTPGGLAAIYICLTVFVFLILKGRRFGKPLDAQERNRRLSSEYVHAMTDLYQKGNTRMEILRHIREQFKYDLGMRWRVSPTLSTDAFLEELTQRGAIDDDQQLAELVMDLESSNDISEAQLLDLAQRVEAHRESTKIGRTKLVGHRSF